MPEEGQAAVDSENYEERCEEGCNEDHGDDGEEEEFEDYEDEGFLTTRRKVLMGLIVILLSALISYQVFFKKDPIKSVKIANNLSEAELKPALFSDVKSDLLSDSVSENENVQVALTKEEPDVLDFKGLDTKGHDAESEEYQEEDEEDEDEDGSKAFYDDFEDIGMNEEDYESGNEIDDYEFLEYLDYDFDKEKNENELECENEKELERIIVTEDVLPVPTPVVEVTPTSIVPEPAPIEEEEEDHLELDTVYFVGINPASFKKPRFERASKDRNIMSVRGDGTDLKYYYEGEKHRYYKGETLSCLKVHHESRKAVFKSVCQDVHKLFLLDLDTLKKIEVPFSKDHILVNPSFSPDGQKLVVKSYTNIGVNISIVDLSENTINTLLPLNVTRSPKSIIKPQFTRDGKCIVYADIEEDDRTKFYRLKMDEPEAEPELLFETSVSVSEFILSPHEDKIAFFGKIDFVTDIEYRYKRVIFVLKSLDPHAEANPLIEHYLRTYFEHSDFLSSWSSCGKYIYMMDLKHPSYPHRLQKINVRTNEITTVYEPDQL